VQEGERQHFCCPSPINVLFDEESRKKDYRYTMMGDLTIKGHTRPVTFAVVKDGEFHDPMMGHRIGYSAQTQINRKDFGRAFDAMLGGRWVGSREVEILIEGGFVEQQPEQTA
jgi:polyisoprenoid-binding protein YceI